MIENLPLYIPVTFGLTTIATFILLYIAIKKSSFGHKANAITIGMLAWLTLHAALSLNLFYVNTVGNMPPIFPIGIVPPLVLIAVLFNTKKGQQFIDSLPLSYLTFLSIVRIPVELVLLWLFLNNTIPEMMTFEGRNFDILAGLTAPLIAYFGYKKGKLSRNFLIGWNILGIILLTNIVLMALLSFPTVFQQLNIGKPFMAMLHFPFYWLPSFVVPIVYFTHFVSIRQLLRK